MIRRIITFWWYVDQALCCLFLRDTLCRTSSRLNKAEHIDIVLVWICPVRTMAPNLHYLIISLRKQAYSNI